MAQKHKWSRGNSPASHTLVGTIRETVFSHPNMKTWKAIFARLPTILGWQNLSIGWPVWILANLTGARRELLQQSRQPIGTSHICTGNSTLYLVPRSEIGWTYLAREVTTGGPFLFQIICALWSLVFWFANWELHLWGGFEGPVWNSISYRFWTLRAAGIFPLNTVSLKTCESWNVSPIISQCGIAYKETFYEFYSSCWGRIKTRRRYTDIRKVMSRKSKVLSVCRPLWTF